MKNYKYFNFKSLDRDIYNIYLDYIKDKYKYCLKQQELIELFSKNFKPFIYRNDIILEVVGYLKVEDKDILSVIFDEDLYIFDNLTLNEAIYFLLSLKEKQLFIEYLDAPIKSIKEIRKIINKNSMKFKKIIDNFNQIKKICQEGRIIYKDNFNISKEEYQYWRHPRYGVSNPQKIKSKVWEYGVVSKKSAYELSKEFGFDDNFDTKPSWSYDRFGRAIIFLNDGREIHIAGEHEDYYDPDFFIYNDVTVINPDDSIDFYLYPKDIFRPTDFHTASLIDNKIYIIGNLGYEENIKYGYTQVYELDLKDFSIKEIESKGQMPGWIHEHDARVIDKDKIEINGGLIMCSPDSGLIKNRDNWIFDTKTHIWKKKD